VINPTPVPKQSPPVFVQQPLSAKTVMNWFRWRSLGRRGAEPHIAMEKQQAPPTEQSLDSYVGAPAGSSSSTIGQTERNFLSPQVIVTSPGPEAKEKESHPPVSARNKWTRTPSEGTTTPSRGLANLVRTVTSPRHTAAAVVGTATINGKFDASSLRIHHGAVDQAMITNGSPPLVFEKVTKVLESMGVELHRESEFKYKCTRPKKGTYAVIGAMGTAASNGVSGFFCHNIKNLNLL